MTHHHTIKARRDLVSATMDFHRICDKNKFNKKLILSSSRKVEAVDNRQFLARILRGKGYSYPIIGQVLNRNHTSIIHLVNCRGAA